MSRLKQAINTLLLSIGQESTDDLTEPSALMARDIINYAILELPYQTQDFNLDINSLPNEVYRYVLARAGRRFQANMVASEILSPFTEADVVEAGRMLIYARIIPLKLMKQTETELSELLSFASEVPPSLKQDLALLKLQSALLAKDYHVLEAELIYQNYIDFKKRLIASRKVPNEILSAILTQLFAKYGFSGIIPVDLSKPSNISVTLRTLACYEFQKSILNVDEYVISEAEANQHELDLRASIIANRLLPTELYLKTMHEFIMSYGYTQSELDTRMVEYIYLKALSKLQALLLPNEAQHIITSEDLDNAEAGLITNLIIPKNIYERVYKEIKIELGIEDEVKESEIPEAVRVYARYKGAYIHQPTAILRPAKYVIDKEMLIRQKALAGQSLPTLSLMSAKAVSRITDKENNPSATTSSTSQKYRLKVADANTSY